MVLNGAQILVEELIRQGVKTVFGYPGGTIIDIYDELYKNADRIGHVLPAHEQGAAHAADGYARVSGETGVVIATSGPGATNLVTGIANAYLDSVPLVAITGNVAVPLLGRDSFQEVDIVGITQPIVKHSYLVRDVKDLESVLKEAFAIAAEGRKGPVLVDLPKSVQRDRCEYRGDSETYGPAAPVPELREALEVIKKCRRPFIYCGGGVIASRAEQEVLELSKRLGAPVGLSMMGLTALPDSYGLNLGMCGMHGTYASNQAQSEADLMIAAGIRFSDRATGNIEEYTKNCTIIHIDIDEAELGKNVPGIIELCGDAKSTLRRLLEEVAPFENREWVEKAAANRKRDDTQGDRDEFSPRNIIRTVERHVGADTVVATDVGQHQMWVAQHYPFQTPRTLLTSGGLGTMGFGLGAAVGGCIASGRRRTVLFTGDGSFGMNLNEMATAVTQKLPLLIVLFRNGTLGMVRQWQSLFYDRRHSCTTLNRKTDFVRLAEAFGAAGRTVSTLEELQAVFRDGIPDDGPFLIDCRIDIDEMVFPMIPPGGSVKDIQLK
jgi:acetolactate synthase-1/2/3 large subunit